MKYLSVEHVLFIHSLLVSQTGGSHGVRDLGMLDSAVSRPQAVFDGKDLYPDVYSKAAALMDSLINNHPFVDGNKRTGITAAGLFLQINGHRLTASAKALEKMTLNVATKAVRVAELADWMRSNTEQPPA